MHAVRTAVSDECVAEAEHLDLRHGVAHQEICRRQGQALQRVLLGPQRHDDKEGIVATESIEDGTPDVLAEILAGVLAEGASAFLLAHDVVGEGEGPERPLPESDTGGHRAQGDEDDLLTQELRRLDSLHWQWPRDFGVDQWLLRQLLRILRGHHRRSDVRIVQAFHLGIHEDADTSEGEVPEALDLLLSTRRGEELVNGGHNVLDRGVGLHDHAILEHVETILLGHVPSWPFHPWFRL
mmetsp:Transcript_126586/g.270004  ORF Transcript_126586/g.270004 Transcript_126586/m.270004 type:complete len:239 (-) Transcript_126586:573-1289(-)